MPTPDKPPRPDQPIWDRVDRYLDARLIPDDPVLTAALEDARAAGLPAIHVTPTQGMLLHVAAMMCGASNILEIGTLAGYSTIFMARALPPGGRLVTLESEPRHAEVASANIARAGLSHVVDIRLAPALETLPRLHVEREAGAAPFDLVFIDADKENLPAYFDHAMRLARPGSIIIADNVIRDGAVADDDSDDPRVRGARAYFDRLASTPNIRASAVQTVGAKGYDGFAIAIVLPDSARAL